MRICLFPVYSSRFVPASPSINFVRALIVRAQEIDPKTTFYVIAPSKDDPAWEYGKLDVLGGLPRTHVVYLPMYRNQFDDLSLITRDFWERFNERFGDLYFDVLINERPMLAPMLQKLAAFHLEGRSRVPVVINRAQIVVKKEWFKLGEFCELQEIVGMYSAPTVFQSPHQLKMAVNVARKYLKPAQIEVIKKNAVVFPLGIDCTEVDAINGEERKVKNEEVTINYSHKIFLEQKFMESLTIMDSVLAGGRHVRVQVVTGSAESKFSMLKRARKFRHMEIHGRMDRPSFLRQMAKAHIFISNSWYEDFSATVVEQIYTGLIPVLVRADWSEYLVPDDYPFLFESMTDGQGMLRYVVDNYEEIRDEWVPRLQAHVLEHFDLGTIAADMFEWMKQMRFDRDGVNALTPMMRELADEVWEELPEVFDIADVTEVTARLSTNVRLDVERETHSISRWWFVDKLLAGRNVEDQGDLIVSWRKL